MSFPVCMTDPYPESIVGRWMGERDMSYPNESPGDQHIELDRALSRAVDAARRGDLETLEVELRSLPFAVAQLSTKLRAIARAVQAHPSFTARQATEAG